MAETYIPSEILDSLPSTVKFNLVKMSQESQLSFVEEYKRKRKTMPMAYLAWCVFYIHNIYLEKGFGIWFLQILSLCMIVGIAWVIIDLFRIPKMVRELNADIAKSIFRDIKIIEAS